MRLAIRSARFAVRLAALGAAPIVAVEGQGVGFRARVSPDTVYVGQQASYELTVTIPADVRQRLRRNPQFVAPEARAMLAYDLPTPKAAPPGEGTEVHVFRRALFPLTTGRYTIPAAQLTFALPQSPSFFSREDERSLRSEPVSFVAIAPPAAGRPAEWGGAVGRWRTRARVDSQRARVGDPFVLTLRVEGTGNATLLPRPELSIPWAIVVPEDERVVLDSTPTTLGGAKEFAWLVTPKDAGARQVPSLAYAFFDPVARRYEVARTAPIAVRVSAGDLVTIPPRAAGARDAAPLPVRAQLAGPAAVALPAAPVWAWIALIAPLPWLVARWRSRRPRGKREPTPAEKLRSAAAVVPGEVRALFDAALRERTGIALEGVTGPGALAAALRREGVTPEVSVEAEKLRDALDAAAYARAPGSAELRTRARTLMQRIGDEARRQKLASLLLVALLLGAVACVPATVNTSQEALSAFAEGQTAYAGQDWARARDAFLRAANASPRDRNAWANFGSASWQAADTAAAVLGWQRALRLDPLDAGMRPRLARVRAPQTRGAARVWPLPVLPLAIGAFSLWCAGWAWSAARRFRRKPGRRGALLILPGALVAALALFAEWQSRATDLVVIATATPLRALPALGAEAGSVPLIGEVVRVRETRGVWLRIELEAGREGWYPAERTYPLARE